MTYYSDQIINYLKKHDLTREMFACICRICSASVSKLLSGSTPGPLLSKKIFIATKGEVNLNIPYRKEVSNDYSKKKVRSKSSMVCDKREEFLLSEQNGIETCSLSGNIKSQRSD